MQSELDPITKEKAARLLEHLHLDQMEELLTESAVMARVRQNANADVDMRSDNATA
jgi:hypothetical protein